MARPGIPAPNYELAREQKALETRKEILERDKQRLLNEQKAIGKDYAMLSKQFSDTVQNLQTRKGDQEKYREL
jgi:hypothetical protein